MSEEIRGEDIVHELALLSSKPQIYLFNGEEADISDELKHKVKELGADYIAVNLAEAENIDALIRKAYESLGLISFFTTGPEESRAWTIKKGWKAPQAAGVIHSDFEHKFIRAEVVGYEKLVEAGNWAAAKQKGWLRLEGKEYIVVDGDVLEIRHG